jgi:hypothetical protein
VQALTQQTLCEHQLIFSPALDDAATCARCGAIVLIAPPRHDESGVRLEWLPSERTGFAGEAVAAETNDD